MTRTQSFGIRKDTRTQIIDLPEIAVELSERDLRIVTGGLAVQLACNSAASAKISPFMGKTDYNTNGDHDSDSDGLPVMLA